MQDFEKLGVFYLGREYDPRTDALAEAPLLYDAKDLTTHAVCLGMTGSGKMGLCISLTPRKSDIPIGEIRLAWEPWRAGADGFPAPAWQG